jgi:hypothetical protein
MHKQSLLSAMRLHLLLAAGVGLAFGATTVGAQNMWDNIDGHLGSLAPENLNMERPAPPFDLTGTWYIDGEWRFLPLPEFTPAAQEMLDLAAEYRAQGITFNDPTGKCWPPGMPIVMTRVWPIHMIQLPTAIVMISNFEDQVRWIFMDGREHTDPDLYAPTYNGESMGHWEGDTLVIDTRNFDTKFHNVDGVPISDQFRIIERVRLLEGGEKLEIEYTMTDPANWEGEWVSTKNYARQHKVDFLEVHCLPDTNDGILSTSNERSILPGQ